MKLFITILSIYCIANTNNSFAFAIIKPVSPMHEVISLNNIKASEFVKLSAKDYSIITGKKLNLWNRISFSLLKMRIKHDLKNNPNLKISEYYSKKSRHMSPWLWIGIGLVVVLIILLLAGLTVYG